MPVYEPASGGTGPQGPAGADGRAGQPVILDAEEGLEGPIGPPGQAGAAGSQGAAGTPGVATFLEADATDGEPGPPGAVGAAGAAGSTGAQGPVGPGVFLEAESVEGEPGAPGTPGVAGVAGTTGPQGPVGPAVFLEAESIEGETGSPGPVGAAGAAGATGAQGAVGPAVFLEAEGEQGEQGFPGPTGPPATLASGSVRVTHSVAQSISTGGFVALAFDTERYDDSAMHDTVTNNTRLTIKTAGRYIVTGSIEFAAGAGATRGIGIAKNAASMIAQEIVAPSAGLAPTAMAIATQHDFIVGDFVELYAIQNSGGGLNINKTADYSPEFAAQIASSSTGLTGPQGPMGPAVFLEADAEEGPMGPPGTSGGVVPIASDILTKPVLSNGNQAPGVGADFSRWDHVHVLGANSTKGNIVIGIGGTGFEHLPAGTDGTILSADSTTGEGLAWITAPGNIKTTEQDFGSANAYFGSWTISDTSVTTTSNVRCWLSAEAPTSRDGDEAEMEPMNCTAQNMAAGSFLLVAEVLDGPVDGLYKFNYLVG